MLKRCEDTNLCLNWEKSHFMVKEGIVLGHKISKNRIEVDKAKVDVIAKLPHPTTVKGVRSFLGHAGFYRRFIKDFSKISRPMTHLLEKNTLFIFSDECIQAFETLKKKLTEAPILIAPDWDLPFELMCDASDFAIGHRSPSSPRPPAKPPDDDEIEPDTGLLNAKVVGDIAKHYVFKPRILTTQPTLSPHLLSHRGFKAFQLISDFSESPMMIYEGNIPILDVPFIHFYPP
ncbi:reverse transcriptase domain-containing protein [Tanacetum coccineum]|uniref:Reverse transcriptase domain-containing protein n=1 Tax=Tanacetum coccineum TaxID=301880 RepID=A0ABQ5BJE7_9ASTR